MPLLWAGGSMTIPAWRVERTRDEMLCAPVSRVEMGFRARCKVRFRNLSPRAQRAVNPCTVRGAWFDVCNVQCLTLSTGQCGGLRRIAYREQEATRRMFWNWFNCKNRKQSAAYRATGVPIVEIFELRKETAPIRRCGAALCPVCGGRPEKTWTDIERDAKEALELFEAVE